MKTSEPISKPMLKQSESLIAVIGASGKTGTRVVNLLQQQGRRVRPLSRHSDIPFDWQNRSGWSTALRDVTAAYVTYYPDLAVPQAEADIQALVAVAKAEGVEQLVLLSGRGEDGAQKAEIVVQESGLRWNIVRASWFMQNFSESFMLEGLQDGMLVLPQPKAKEPFIDVDDIAEIAVAALTKAELANQLFEVTGPELLTFSQCIADIATASERSIDFLPVPVDAFLAGAKAQGVPDDMSWLVKELFVNVLDGRNEFITDTVEQVLGKPARRFSQYVDVTSPSGVWHQVNA